MTRRARFFDPPKPGDIVWCRFPEERDLKPAPKSRPALVLSVGTIGEETAVVIAYGTSQKVGRLYAVELPYNDRWFAVPPGASFGQQPRLGLLHPSLMTRAEAAFRAARRRR